MAKTPTHRRPAATPVAGGSRPVPKGAKAEDSSSAKAPKGAKGGEG